MPIAPRQVPIWNPARNKACPNKSWFYLSQKLNFEKSQELKGRSENIKTRSGA
jgi:hypothetical protein